jgi:hypothetical protein
MVKNHKSIMLSNLQRDDDNESTETGILKACIFRLPEQQVIDNDLTKPLIQKDEASNKLDNKQWVSYTLGATILFTTGNIAFSEVSRLGVDGMLYVAPGCVICGLAYFSIFGSSNVISFRLRDPLGS